MKIINCEKLVLGRIATETAENILKGEQVILLNVEKAVVTGTLQSTLKRYKKFQKIKAKGNPLKGPKFKKSPIHLMKKAVKGMLPHQKARGRKALKLLKAFQGIPEKFKGKKTETIKKAGLKSGKSYTALEEISKMLGWRQ